MLSALLLTEGIILLFRHDSCWNQCCFVYTKLCQNGIHTCKHCAWPYGEIAGRKLGCKVAACSSILVNSSFTCLVGMKCDLPYSILKDRRGPNTMVWVKWNTTVRADLMPSFCQQGPIPSLCLQPTRSCYWQWFLDSSKLMKLTKMAKKSYLIWFVFFAGLARWTRFQGGTEGWMFQGEICPSLWSTVWK